MTLPIIQIIIPDRRDVSATDIPSLLLQIPLNTKAHITYSCRLYFTACLWYSIVHYTNNFSISLVILLCTGKQEQLINLRRQSYPLNIKYHPSPGTTLMRRKWHEGCGHASLIRPPLPAVVSRGLCRAKNKRCFHIYDASLKKKNIQSIILTLLHQPSFVKLRCAVCWWEKTLSVY